jgi:hypothetical protein
MKNAFYLISLVAGLAFNGVAAETGATEWGPVTNNVQMSISLLQGRGSTTTNGHGPLLFPGKEENGRKSSTETSGESVVLLVKLRNLSTNQTFAFYQAGELERSSAPGFDVTLPSGKPVTIRPTEPMHSSGGFIRVRPGQTLDLHFDLTRFCKFNDVGTYTIVAKWALEQWGGGERAEPTSNSLTLLVSDRPWKIEETRKKPGGS